MNIYYDTKESILGHILIAKSDKGIVALFVNKDIEKMKKELEHQYPKFEIIQDKKIQKELEEVFNLLNIPHYQPHLIFRFDMKGTEFQQEVWNFLKTIPYGTTMNYQEIAEKLNRPKSHRAVARACATNNIAVIVPCHRVIKKDGSLSGYRWGIDVKQRLLEIEQHTLEKD